MLAQWPLRIARNKCAKGWDAYCSCMCPGRTIFVGVSGAGKPSNQLLSSERNMFALWRVMADPVK